MIQVTTLRDGGQTADEIARRVVAFVGAAERSLDLALYDVDLLDAEAKLVAAALVAAHERGVAVRIAYNLDYAAPIPVPPPPEGVPDLIEQLPVETKGIAGEPDLMHHKYVIRDGESVWTGSMNWTADSWTRQENVVAVVHHEYVAANYTRDFEELWQSENVATSGDIDPNPIRVDGRKVRTWFCPGRGESLAHRIANRIARSRERIRIASPVLTSAPILGSLAEAAADRKIDIAGVVDGTQMKGVYYQWRLNGNAAWKMPLLEGIFRNAPFSGKRSTPYGRGDNVHDYMHAKVTIADDTVFAGSYNLSHSGEQNAENVLEIHDADLADRLAAFVDEVRALYPPAPLPGESEEADERRAAARLAG